MANRLAVTIPLADISRIQVYINSPRRTVAQIKRDTGADYILNGTLYNMRTGKVNCHLKVDGEVIASPDYAAQPYMWDVGPDISLGLLPGPTKENHIACTLLVKNGKPEKTLYYDPGQGGSRGRSAIGIKGDNLCLYCTKDGTDAARTPERLRDDLAAAGWNSAIMLDGGGSSQCDFAGDKITSSRKVQHLLLVYLKNPVCPYNEPSRTIGKGSVGTGARWVQWQLNRHGAALTVDGVFGSKSVEALTAFQKSVFADPDDWDGRCGPMTRAELKKQP